MGIFGGSLKKLGFCLVDLRGQFLPFGIVLLNCSDQLIFLFFEGLVFKQQSVVFVQEGSLFLSEGLKNLINFEELRVFVVQKIS